MENIYILAGSQREALQGIDGRGKTLICTGTYWKREDYARIRDCADVRGFTIKEVGL